MSKTAKKRNGPEEFFVLLRGGGNSVEAINWRGHGKWGVYTQTKPEPGDRILLVREVKYRKKPTKTK